MELAELLPGLKIAQRKAKLAGRELDPESDARYKKFLEAPELEDYDYPYYQAFQRLRRGRNNGMGVVEIPHEAIISYMDEREIPPAQRTFFYAVIETVDGLYCEHIRSKQKGKENMQQGIEMSNRFNNNNK